MAAKLLEFRQSEVIAQILPGLGTLSPASLCFDGVSIGNSLFSRGESFTVFVLSTISASSGRLFPQFVASPSSGLLHDGPSQAAVVLSSLETHASKLTTESLRSRVLCMVGGDGAVCKGGPDSRHASSAAGNIVAASVYPRIPEDEQHAEWEEFHRGEAAYRASVNASEFAKELFAMGKSMSQSFGTGVGRVLLRGMAGVLGDGERIAVAADAGGTPQGVALQRIAANLLDNYSHYALGLHARISRRKAGHGGASQASLQELGRRLLSIDFVVFALAFRDMMERQSVFTRSVQAQGEPPWLTAVSFRHKQQQCREDLQLLYELRRWSVIFVLLQHYSEDADLQALNRSLLYTRMGRRFYHSTRNLFSVIVHRVYDRVQLQILTDLRPGTMTLTPRCSCRFRKTRDSRQVVQKIRIGGRSSVKRSFCFVGFRGLGFRV